MAEVMDVHNHLQGLSEADLKLRTRPILSSRTRKRAIQEGMGRSRKREDFLPI